MAGSLKISWARLCLKGVIKPLDYLLRRRLTRRKNNYMDHERKDFTLTDYTNDECKILFRFSKSELLRLAAALGICRTYILRNRTKFSGIEGLCILLRRLAYPNRLNDLVKTFHRDTTAMSRIINFMVGLLFEKHSQKMSSFSQSWLKPDVLEEFTNACNDAGAPYSNVIGFIDGTNRQICRPTHNQQAFYSGYKKKHCVKYQSTVFPNGIIGRLDGPYIGRRHDSAILHLSKILEEMREKFVNVQDGTHYVLLGDPGYSNQKFIRVGFKNNAKLTAQQAQFNKDLSSLRVSAEYGFGQIVNQFAYLDFGKTQKLHKIPIKKLYFAAAFLVNCQTCIRGNQISSYFNCLPPTLEDYVK